MPKQQSRSRGQIIEKGVGKYLVRVFIGRDASGKRKYASETATGTRSDAEKALTALQAKQDGGAVVAKTKVTLGDHLKSWLSSRVDIAKKTLMDYEHRMEKDIYPFLGKRPLSSISKEVLQAHVKLLSETRNLSPRTIKYTMVVLKQALEAAVTDGLLSRNPAKHVKLPKRDYREPEVHSPEQMQLFLERTIQGDVQFHALAMVLLTTGLRPQEVCALKWDDIDEKSNWIMVQRALKKIAKSQWEIGEVKTAAGRRTVIVPEETMVALRRHRARQAAEILRAEPGRYKNQGFVFASRKHNPGNFLDIGTLRRWWKLELKNAGLPVLKLYSARHSHATALLASGIHPKIAQERLGHSNINVTMDTYTHVIAGMQQQASDRIGVILFKRTGT